MDKPLGITPPQHGAIRILAETVGAHGDKAHPLDAARHDHVIGARDHALRGELQRLLGRSAFAVQRHGGDAFGEARRQHRLPPDIARLLADLDHAAREHVVDQRRIDPGSGDQRLEHLRIEIDRMQAIQHAARPATAERRSHAIDDDGAPHVSAGAGNGLRTAWNRGRLSPRLSGLSACRAG